MAKQLVNDEDSLKRQARRRLVGAVVLVTVVVAVLPMVLDTEPKSSIQNVELRIPDKNKAGEFVPNAALPSVPAMTQPPASTAVTSASAPAATASASSNAAVAASQVVAAPQQPAAKAVATSAQVQAVAPEQKAAPAKAEAKPAEPEQKEQAGQPAGFLIQIGAFSNFDTAHRWQKNLLKQNIKAYTEKAGDKLRVRAGPYATREAAEKVRHRLESQGLHPNIIAQE